MRLFEEQEALEKVNAFDSKLRRIKQNVTFEMFRPTLEMAFGKKVDAPVGRPSFDVVMMFKILLLKQAGWVERCDVGFLSSR